MTKQRGPLRDQMLAEDCPLVCCLTGLGRSAPNPERAGPSGSGIGARPVAHVAIQEQECITLAVHLAEFHPDVPEQRLLFHLLRDEPVQHHLCGMVFVFHRDAVHVVD